MPKWSADVLRLYNDRFRAEIKAERDNMKKSNRDVVLLLTACVSPNSDDSGLLGATMDAMTTIPAMPDELC